MDTITKSAENFAFGLGVIIIREGPSYVAYMPALDLSTHGDSIEDTLNAAKESASAFLDSLSEMNTLDEVLLNLGWQKDNESASFPYTPPEIISAVSSIQIQCHA